MPIIPIKCKATNIFKSEQICKTGNSIKSKYLSNIQQTRYPTPKRYKEANHYPAEKSREGKSLQLVHQNSSQPTDLNKNMSRIYISTPLTCQSEVKPRSKKQCATKDRYKRFSHKQVHSIANCIELKSTSNDSTSVTIYNNYSGSMFPKIKETDSIRSRKSSDKPIATKKNPAGVYIPPKILDFHPYIGLTPEMMHVIDYV